MNQPLPAHRRPFTFAKLLLLYGSALVTYTITRIPIGVLILGFAKDPHPDTIAWAMRYSDCVVYFPYSLVSAEEITRFERSDLFAALVIGYFGTATILAIGLSLRAVFRWVYDFLEVLMR